MQKLHYRINDMFWSVQGEGFYLGRSALFIRLPGCNLACPWCDTKHNEERPVTITDIQHMARSQSSKLAVITGGEPLLNMTILGIIDVLKREGFYIACETNGTRPPVEGLNWITCSPKREANYEVNSELAERVNEYKFIVDEDFDFENVRKIGPRHVCWLVPEWNTQDKAIPRILEFIKTHPQWQLGCQAHKYQGVK